jgi:hypothetical protein
VGEGVVDHQVVHILMLDSRLLKGLVALETRKAVE